MGLNFNAFAILRRAVEEGAGLGVNRAYKHTDSPDNEAIIDSVISEIMNSISEIVEWEYPG